MNAANLVPGKVYTPTRDIPIESAFEGWNYTLRPGDGIEYVRSARDAGLRRGRFFRRVGGDGTQILLYSISDLVEVKE